MTPVRSPKPWQVQVVLFTGLVAGAWALIFGRLSQQEQVPSLYIVAFRLVLSSLLLLPLILTRYRDDLRHLGRRELLFACAAGFWMAIHFVAVFNSIENTSILVSSMLLGSGPLWIALIESQVLKVQHGRLVWLGLAITLTGTMIISLTSAQNLDLGANPVLGIILALGAAIASSLYALLGRQSRGKLAFVPYLWLLYTSAAVVAVVIVLVTQTPLVGYSAAGYGYLTLLTLIPHLIGHSTFNFALRHLPATYVSIVGQFGLVLSAILAFVIFHEIPGLGQIPGSAAILAGITLVNLGQSRSPN